MYYANNQQPQQRQPPRRRMPPLGLLQSIFGGQSASSGAVGGGNSIGAGGASSGGGGGGIGAMGMGGIIGAGILGQHLLSRQTNTEFEGQKTDDAFAGHFATEPWLAALYDKLGFKPSAGERFDAAVDNGDWGTAAKRLPMAANYWANPAGSVGYDFVDNILGSKAAGLTDPVQGIMRLLGG